MPNAGQPGHTDLREKWWIQLKNVLSKPVVLEWTYFCLVKTTYSIVTYTPKRSLPPCVILNTTTNAISTADLLELHCRKLVSLSMSLKKDIFWEHLSRCFGLIFGRHVVLVFAYQAFRIYYCINGPWNSTSCTTSVPIGGIKDVQNNA